MLSLHVRIDRTHCHQPSFPEAQAVSINTAHPQQSAATAVAPDFASQRVDYVSLKRAVEWEGSQVVHLYGVSVHSFLYYRCQLMTT